MGWKLSLDKTVALLQRRCALVGYDEVLDKNALRAGSALPCMRVLRFLFLRYSELLVRHVEAQGVLFWDEMSDDELVRGMFAAWPLMSPGQTPPPSLNKETVAALGGGWHLLLLTLECMRVCACCHQQLIQEETARTPQTQSGSTCHTSSMQSPNQEQMTTEDNISPSMMRWMAEAYTEQLRSIDSVNEPEDGVVEQAPGG